MAANTSAHTSTSTSTGGFAWGFTILLVLAVPLYALAASSAAGSRASDAAGNGMAQAFGIAAVLLLWLVLSIMLVIARKHGAIPGWAMASLIVLVPLSAIGVAVSIGIYSDRGNWLIVVPVAAPLVLLLYATWARFSTLQGLLAVEPANAIVVAVLALATVAPFISVWL
jgi:hypothetical protein